MSMCSGNTKLSNQMTRPPSENSLYLYMALHDPVFFFLLEKRELTQERQTFALQMKENQLYGTDRGLYFRRPVTD